MTLYQLDRTGIVHDRWNEFIDWLIRDEVLIPVEPCEHGNIDPHWAAVGTYCEIRTCTNAEHQCEGADL